MRGERDEGEMRDRDEVIVCLGGERSGGVMRFFVRHIKIKILYNLIS